MKLLWIALIEYVLRHRKEGIIILFDGLKIMPEHNVVLGTEYHICENCFRKEKEEDPVLSKKKLAGRLTGKKIFVVGRFGGEDVVLCHDCLVNAAKLTE